MASHPNSIFNISVSLQILLSLLLLLQLQTLQTHAIRISQNKVKTEVFLSPKFELEPGLVSNKFYTDIDFPRGHFALKSFNAEIVDEAGNQVPLDETYLHHWILLRYYLRKDEVGNSDNIPVENAGLCDDGLTQYYGLGAETRRTATYVPDPYGVEIGNPADIPDGYKEGWVLNVHAIDTRGTRDKMGCAECRCNLYNVTADGNGQALPQNYKGGVRCCHDESRCEVGRGFHGVRRSLYLRYTIKYVEWDESSIVPVKIYILDVTDVWMRGDESRGVKDWHHCVIEYDVDSCRADVANNGSCIHSKTVTVSLPASGDVIYGVGHQHAGATATALYREGGQVICSSKPIYGQADTPGNEAGYVVGMTTCYPSPGSVRISAGEKLTLVSNYSNDQSHTGVMGLFYLLVAESSDEHKLGFGNPAVL